MSDAALRHLGRLRPGLSYVVDYLQTLGKTGDDFRNASPVPCSWPIPGEYALAHTGFGKSSRALVRPTTQKATPWVLTPELILMNYRSHMLSDQPSEAMLAAYEERKGFEGGLIPRLYLSPFTKADEDAGHSPGLVAAVAVASLMYYEVGGLLTREPGTYATTIRGLTVGVVNGHIVGTKQRWPTMEPRDLLRFLSFDRRFPLDGLNSSVVQLRNLLRDSAPHDAPTTFTVCDQVLAFAGMAYRRDWTESSQTASVEWDLECDLLGLRVQDLFNQKNQWVQNLHKDIQQSRDRINLLIEALKVLDERTLADRQAEVLLRGMLVPAAMSASAFNAAVSYGGGRDPARTLGNTMLRRNLQSHLALEEGRILKKESKLNAKRDW